MKKNNLGFFSDENNELKIVYDEYMPCVRITGIKKTKRNEKLVTFFVRLLLGKEMVTPITLNNWKGEGLLIRFGNTIENLEMIIRGIELDLELPEDHPERSLIIDETKVLIDKYNKKRK